MARGCAAARAPPGLASRPPGLAGNLLSLAPSCAQELQPARLLTRGVSTAAKPLAHPPTRLHPTTHQTHTLPLQERAAVPLVVAMWRRRGVLRAEQAIGDVREGEARRLEELRALHRGQMGSARLLRGGPRPGLGLWDLPRTNQRCVTM